MSLSFVPNGAFWEFFEIVLISFLLSFYGKEWEELSFVLSSFSVVPSLSLCVLLASLTLCVCLLVSRFSLFDLLFASCSLIYITTCLSICLSTYLFISINQSIYRPIYLLMCLFLSVNQSIYISINFYVYLSIYLPVPPSPTLFFALALSPPFLPLRQNEALDNFL